MTSKVTQEIWGRMWKTEIWERMWETEMREKPRRERETETWERNWDVRQKPRGERECMRAILPIKLGVCNRVGLLGGGRQTVGELPHFILEICHDTNKHMFVKRFRAFENVSTAYNTLSWAPSHTGWGGVSQIFLEICHETCLSGGS